MTIQILKISFTCFLAVIYEEPDLYIMLLLFTITIVAIKHGLLKKFWPLVLGCVLRTAGLKRKIRRLVYPSNCLQKMYLMMTSKQLIIHGRYFTFTIRLSDYITYIHMIVITITRKVFADSIILKFLQKQI